MLCILILIIFIIYFYGNKIPRKIEYNFTQKVLEQTFINQYEIEKNDEEIKIFLNMKDTIFKHYDYHSYVSGDGSGKKLQLEMYLISEDEALCYKIKSYCYDYQNIEELKFMGYYDNKFINKSQKYNLSIYVPDTEILYITNIEL